MSTPSFGDNFAEARKLRENLLEMAEEFQRRGEWEQVDQIHAAIERADIGLTQTAHRVDQLDAKINQIETTQAELDSIGERIRQLKSGDNPNA